MTSTTLHDQPQHPIAVVARRTGISQQLLRAWERRHRAVQPARTPTGRRLYSDLDLERLTLIKQLVDGGRRIGSIARLPLPELGELLRADRHLPGRPALDSTPKGYPGLYLQECIQAVAALDERKLQHLLDEANVEFSRQVLRQDILAPLIQTVGDRWEEGSLKIVHEHMMTAVVRSFLGRTRPVVSSGGRAPLLVVTTPAGQLHELGALLTADAAGDLGWDVIYLGPNLPAAEIASAVRLHQADAVALSLVYPSGDPLVHQELQQLHRLLGNGFPIIIGGAAAPAYRRTIEEIGAEEVSNLAGLQKNLAASA